MLKSIMWTSWQPGAMALSLPKLLLPVGMFWSALNMENRRLYFSFNSLAPTWELKKYLLDQNIYSASLNFFTYGQRISKWEHREEQTFFNSRCCPARPHIPVTEGVGTQVGVLAVLQFSFDELIQCFLKERLVLCIHILNTLQCKRSSRYE